MKKVLIIGAAGMLGHKLCQLLPEMGYSVAATVRKSADDYQGYDTVFNQTELIGGIDVLADGALQRALEQANPDVVINCVGVIKQRKEAEDRYLSVGINSWLPHHLAKLCDQTGARLIHLSTDCVFDGQRGSYKEDDASNATDLYGKSKYLGETDSNQKNAVTIRTSIIGRELTDPKQSLIEWFLSQNSNTIKGFTKAIYTGFTTNEMARIIAKIIETPEIHGLFQVASAPINKYDLLAMLRDKMKLDIQIDEDNDFFCDRSMIMDRFTKETGYEAPSWDDMLTELANDKTPYDKWN